MPVPRPVTSRGRQAERRRRSAPRPGWCCRCPCRRRAAAAHRRRSPRARPAGRPRARARSPRRSARPRGGWRRCPVVPCARARRRARRSGPRRRRCRAPARATSWAEASALTPASPATKVRTIAPVIAGGYAETPWAATPWSPAKITSRTLVSGSGGTDALGAGDPDREVAEPTERSGRGGQSVEALLRPRAVASGLGGWTALTGWPPARDGRRRSARGCRGGRRDRTGPRRAPPTWSRW